MAFECLLLLVLTFIAVSLAVPPLLLKVNLQGMSWVEKLLFAVLAFQAFAFGAWLIYLRREMKEEKKKIH
jgi:hypothetical protein